MNSTVATVTNPNALGGHAPETDPRAARRISVALVVVACIPIVVACVRALMHHWTPISDNGLLALRAQDVFSRHLPLLGTASSASASGPKPFNNPGPLYFDLLAIPVWVFGSAAGTALGVTVVNIAAIVLTGLASWRRAGVIGTSIAMLVASTLAWSMGSELLYDPWQPHGLLLPFLAFLFLVWAMAAGDFAMLPVAVLVASVLAQTHLTYGFLAPGLLAVGLVAGWLTRREVTKARSDEPEPGRVGPITRVGPWIAVAGLVGLVVWTQPIIEQFTTTNDGNVSRVAHQLQHPSKHVVGALNATRLTATVIARPPFWLRNSFSNTFRPAGSPYGTMATTVDDAGAVGATASVVALVGVLAVFGGAGYWAQRRRDRTARNAVVVATAALAVGWYTASKVTTDTVGVAPHQFRFLWPVAAFLVFALTLVAVRTVQAPAARWRAVRILRVAVLVMVVWNIPASAAHVGPQLESGAIPVIRALDRQLGAAAPAQPLLLDFSGIRFSEPFSGAIMAELRRREIEFVTTDGYLGRQLGPTRVSNGHDAPTRILYRSGAAARRRSLGALTRIAFVDGLSRSQHRRLRALERQIGSELAAHGLRMTPKLAAGMKLGLFGTLHGPFTNPEFIQRVFETGELAGAVDAHALALPPEWRGRFAEYARLWRRADLSTIGVFTGPVDATVPKS